MTEQQPSYEFKKPVNGVSRLRYNNLAVKTFQEPTSTLPPLTDWEKSQPFVFDTGFKLIESNLETDFYFISPSGDRFCLFNSENTDTSVYLQQETKIFLKSLNQQQDPSMIQNKFAEFYGQINNTDMAPARGVFCLTSNHGRQPTMVIANCGGFVYLLRPSSRQPYNLGDRNNPGSFGVGSNPKELFVSSVMIQTGDVIFATPDPINDKTREEITNYLKHNKGPASDLAVTCRQIIRESTIYHSETPIAKEASALIISVRQSSNQPSKNSVDRRYVPTHRKTQLKDLLPFRKK